MPRIIHESDDLVYACPSCDLGGGIYERVGRGNAHVGDADARYLCEKCSATFDEPVERPARDGWGYSKLERLLAAGEVDP